LWDHAFSLARIINSTDEDAEAYQTFILAAVSSSDLFWQEPQANRRAKNGVIGQIPGKKRDINHPHNTFFCCCHPLPSTPLPPSTVK